MIALHRIIDREESVLVLRIIAIATALMFAPVWVALADEPTDTEEIIVPPPPPPRAMEPAPPPPMAQPMAQPIAVVAPEAVEAPPPPFVELESTAIAAGIGLSWGDGTLNYEGENHTFSVRSISLLDLGAARMRAEGPVENLASLADFEGRYVAVQVGAAAGIGGSLLRMQNDKGVVITLRSQLTGVQLKLAAEGFEIALD